MTPGPNDMALVPPGDQPKPARRKKKADRPDAEPAVARCIQLYHDLFTGKFPGIKPLRGQFARFGKALKDDLLPSWGEPAVGDTLRLFFSTKDPRVSSGQYAPADFLFHAQRLRIQVAAPTARHDQRTADNVSAAARAAGRRQ